MLNGFLWSFQCFLFFFQIAMPKGHKNYQKCIWQVSTEWHTLGFYSTLLTKMSWNFATHIVRVCVIQISPQTSKFDLTDKCNLQVHFGSKAMASWYELLCHHFFTTNDPLLEELPSYLLIPLSSIILDYIANESSDNESVGSIDSSNSAFYSDDSTYSSEILLYLFKSLCNCKFLQQRPTRGSKKRRRELKDSRRPDGGPKAYSTSIKPPASANFTSWDRNSTDVHAGYNLSHWDFWKPVNNSSRRHSRPSGTYPPIEVHTEIVVSL